MPFIDLSNRPAELKIKIKIAINKVLKHNQFIMGEEVYKFEKKLEQFCCVKNAITCSNGTDALFITLLALNVKKTDAIFIPSFTFVATVESVMLAGGTPIFIDVLHCSFNIDSNSLMDGIKIAKAKKLTPKYIIAVDLFGMPANYKDLENIVNKYDIKLIVDAAQSFGASYMGRKVGSIGFVTITSFFPTKPLGCFGDGGCIFTNDEELSKNIKSIRNHGQGKDKYENIRIGLNSRLDTIQAAILLEKLEYVNNEIEMKNNLATYYNEILENFVEIPKVPNYIKTAWAQYTIKLKHHHDRSEIMNFLKIQLVPTTIYYSIPLHKQKAYENCLRVENILKVSEYLSNKVLSLPMYPYMTNKNKILIFKALKKTFKKYN